MPPIDQTTNRGGNSSSLRYGSGAPAAHRNLADSPNPALEHGAFRSSPSLPQQERRSFSNWPLSPAWLGFLIVVVAYAFGAWMTWRKWPDLLVDFGEQLYLPWRISQGALLYRDVMYLTGGPLSQYYHAALFKLFGVSFLTLIISNLAIGLGLSLLIYRRFLACSDAWTATTLCLGVTLVLAFGQYSDIGNYNFIAPYCPEVWHGVALSIVALSFLSSWLLAGRIRHALAAGFCCGLVFMTKPEAFIALMLALAATLILSLMQNGIRASSKFLLCSFAAALLPVLGFVLYFHHFENWRASLRSVAFAWVPLLTTSVSKQAFYKWCMGLDAPGFHLRAMLTQFAIVCLVVAACAFWFRREMNSSAKRLLTFALIALLVALATGVDWVDSGRSLPLLILVLVALLALKYKSTASSALRTVPPANAVELGAAVAGAPVDEAATVAPQSLIFPLLWSIFAFGLLAKLGLFSRIWHYGFILAMPAFVAAVYLLLWQLPGFLEKHGVRRNLFRATICALLMTAFLRLFVQSQHVLSQKTLAVGNGTDKIFTFDAKLNPAGPAVQSALDWLKNNAPIEATLAVLPEGVMVNYLSRRINPTKYLLWNPAEMVGFGQSTMTASFRENPPDYVMLIHRDSSEYGVKFFGQEERFGLSVMQWIDANYETVCLIGNEPLRNSLFGIKILKRTSESHPR